MSRPGQIADPLYRTRDSAPVAAGGVVLCERFVNPGKQSLIRGMAQISHLLSRSEIAVNANRGQRQQKHEGEADDESKLEAVEPPSHC